jgi:hypothetical protein
MISIVTNAKRIPIERDGQPVGELVFDPADVLFAEKFYKLLSDFEGKALDYQARASLIAPNDTGAKFAILRETCDYLRGEIDRVFGFGTSQMVFGNCYKVEVFSQFADGLMPYFADARAEKVGKYAKKQRKVLK